MLGISVYFKDFDQEYIKQAIKEGITYIFTSLHIPEDDLTNVTKPINELLAIVKNTKTQIIPDISPRTFEKLGLEMNDFTGLKNLGFNFVRLDYGFDIKEIAELSKQFYISLNASVITETMIQQLIELNVDLSKMIATHNFYPRKDTGLSKEDFIKKNEIFKKHHIRIQAFIPGDELKRYPIYEGLPTLEYQREYTTYHAALDMMQTYQIDDIIIGDSQTSIETIQHIQKYIENNEIYLKAWVKTKYQTLLRTPLKVRSDQPDKVVRMLVNRTPDIQPMGMNTRSRGTITMDNKLYGRYSGEIHITKEDLQSDYRVNVIGHVHPQYTAILNYIKSNHTIHFIQAD